MTGRMQNELMRLDQSESRVDPKGTIGLQTSMGISEDGVTDAFLFAYRLVVVVVFCFSNGVLLHGDA